MSRLFFQIVLVGSLLAMCAPTLADEFDRDGNGDDRSPVNQDRDDTWYYQPASQPTSYQPNPLAIIHQKALVRSQQRQDRLAALNW